ncbi:Glucoamylase (glucan-1,4-alpha-glucosidase), GH15 family [Geodermatophilus telluris]|uniref:Glucoamylase (Glucan-1,4-alpha-glucosidase), GH15 family n=1 Tax=Geodermatophilus telluris TaxID=1190417 RepID=A0A1G6NWF1_9ACTN|nr:glycoside hydrolase family 15 protein [Geodermatophilus telluris]SDC71495.1 Glucoamylase (glucan-1,4-alpha-glucosidase), GH15 family [Geodermatophilus telluris]
MSSTPIADLAFLSDRHSCALVDRTGTVEWLCFPRFDGPAVFARLLDDDAGHWSVHPDGDWTAARRYAGRSLALETTFRTAGGELVLTDALGLGPDNGGHRIGTDAPHVLVRRLACTAGAVDVVVEYRPRPEYGLIVPLLSHLDGGVAARGGADWLVLTLPGAAALEDGQATARLRLHAGDVVHLALQRSTLGDPEPAHVWSQPELAALLDRTLEAWESWSALHQTYDGPWADLVHLSGRVLQGLSYQPSGAVVAAATTSLPEGVGGERNWDYRYSWVRDASFTMEALWVAACPDEAEDFFAFMTTAGAGGIGPDTSLQIMFGVAGEHDLSERTLGHLRGWRDSRPVRVGNGAWDQRQVDVYGELLGAAARLRDQLPGLDAETRAFLAACADTAAVRWRDRDQGIWEVRGEPQHFLYSKVMCWVALDRAIVLAPQLGCEDRVDAWQKAREEIRDTVLQQGWSEEAGAFGQYFGSTALDASNLMLPIVGFLPADDPRMLATIDAIADRLTDDRGLVYRYHTEEGVDGLAGEEGTFLLCTFWLAQALALAGQVERAREVFERAVGYVGDLGLLAEEVDPATGELLGNVPQAFSHIGLVNAAWAIDQAEQARR